MITQRLQKLPSGLRTVGTSVLTAEECECDMDLCPVRSEAAEAVLSLEWLEWPQDRELRPSVAL